METQKTPRLIESMQLTPGHWRAIKRVVTHAQEFTKMELSKDLELRFVPMEDNSFSILLSYQNLDMAHFMWQEVEGLVNVTHRIVNPVFRGQGIGTELMYAIEQRLQKQANEHNSSIHLMMETSQISVVKLGLRRGMKLTKGVEDFQMALAGKYDLDDNTHVTDENGYRLQFRVSKAIQPLDARIISFRDHARQDILKVLRAA